MPVLTQPLDMQVRRPPETGGLRNRPRSNLPLGGMPFGYCGFGRTRLKRCCNGRHGSAGRRKEKALRRGLRGRRIACWNGAGDGARLWAAPEPLPAMHGFGLLRAGLETTGTGACSATDLQGLPPHPLNRATLSIRR